MSGQESIVAAEEEGFDDIIALYLPPVFEDHGKENNKLIPKPKLVDKAKEKWKRVSHAGFVYDMEKFKHR